MNKEELQKLENFSKILGIKFNDISILKNALVHRSYLNETNNDLISHNERLEFLGDAVLELITTEYLFKKYPNKAEGELTSYRAATVRTESLAHTANQLNFGEYLYVSKGEEMTGGREKPYILANTFESILGSIYIDQGYEVAKEFVFRTLIPKVDKIVELRLDIDDKSKLQEVSQEKLGITPKYRQVDAVGPDHDKVFTMEVIIGLNTVFGQGKGKSKQEAEQNAAKNALKNWDKSIKELKN